MHEFKADAKTGAPAARGEYKVLGEEKIDTFVPSRSRRSSRETAGAEPASVDSTVWLSKTDGSVVRSEAKWVRARLPGPGRATLG